jgi:GDP-L-fucose synthase
MNKDSKIFISGHKGLVGSAICRVLEKNRYHNLLKKNREEVDLTHQEEVFDFLNQERPEHMFLAAAKVGGIHANHTYPVEFFLENIKIQNNLIEGAHKFGVKKLLFLGSSCIFPREATIPIKEESLMTGPLEPTNEAYALAKIAGLRLCSYFNREYNKNFMSAQPTNLFGINDNYHSENAHVIPMLIRRFHEAKEAKSNEVSVWGSGRPKREFLFSDDLAQALVFIMENHDAKDFGDFINIGSGTDITIDQLAHTIKEVVGFEGKIVYDQSKPDGTFRKLMDSSKLFGLGWRPKHSFKEALTLTYKDYLRGNNSER